MSKIEGITPHEKHQTVEERRGKFEPHEEVHARSLHQRELLGVVIVVSVFVILGGWYLLARSGRLFGSSSSDQQFIHSLTNTLSSNQSITSTFDANTSQNVTPNEKKVLDQVDEQLFPEFQQ